MPGTTAFLLVDIQNDYFPGGAMELSGSLDAGRNAALLLGRARERGVPVFHVRHESVRPGATFFLPGTPGAGIHDLVAPRTGEAVVTKHVPNSFRGTGLHDMLAGAGVDRLVIAGMMTHMCIDTTVRAAADLGYRCVLASDASATRDLAWEGRTVRAADVHAAFLAALSGTFAEVMPSREAGSAFGD
jgi:nicotinamidase-related amidase